MVPICRGRRGSAAHPPASMNDPAFIVGTRLQHMPKVKAQPRRPKPPLAKQPTDDTKLPPNVLPRFAAGDRVSVLFDAEMRPGASVKLALSVK